MKTGALLAADLERHDLTQAARAICRLNRVSFADLLTTARTVEVTRARHALWLYCMSLTDAGGSPLYPRATLARLFGVDRSCIAHAAARWGEDMPQKIRRAVDAEMGRGPTLAPEAAEAQP